MQLLQKWLDMEADEADKRLGWRDQNGKTWLHLTCRLGLEKLTLKLVDLEPWMCNRVTYIWRNQAAGRH